MGKYGTNLEGFGAFEGGVNADKGAPLVSTSSDGETALLFGPAALREIQAGVANGDFAIPPDAAGDTITAENPLPYWTFTDTSSGGKITAAIVTDSASASANALRFTAVSGTVVLQEAQLTRYVPVPSSRDRAFVVVPELYVSAASGAKMQVGLKYAFYTSDLTLIGSEVTAGTRTSVGQIRDSIPGNLSNSAPSNAAFVLITIRVRITTADTTATETIDISEVRLNVGSQILIAAESIDPATYRSFTITQSNGSPSFSYPSSGTAIFAGAAQVSGNLTVSGTLIGAGVTTDLKHGITLQRTTNLTVNTSVDASATAITWSSAVKNTTLYSYWSSGSTISIPLTGWYSITCHLISGTGLGTGFAFRLYALVNGTVIAESETQAGANTTTDTFAISTIAYMTAADSLVFRASASAASKTIGGSRLSACSVVYLGNTSA